MNNTESQIGQFLQRLREPVRIVLYPNVKIYVTRKFSSQLMIVTDATTGEFVWKIDNDGPDGPDGPPTAFGIPLFTILDSRLDDNTNDKPYRIVVEL